MWLYKKSDVGIELVGSTPLVCVWKELSDEWWPMWLCRDESLYPLAYGHPFPNTIVVHRKDGVPIVVAIPIYEMTRGDVKNLRKHMTSLCKATSGKQCAKDTNGALLTNSTLQSPLRDVRTAESAIPSTTMPVSKQPMVQGVSGFPTPSLIMPMEHRPPPVVGHRKRNNIVRPNQFSCSEEPAIHLILDYLLSQPSAARFTSSDLSKLLEGKVSGPSLKRCLSEFTKQNSTRPALISYDPAGGFYFIEAEHRPQVQKYLTGRRIDWKQRKIKDDTPPAAIEYQSPKKVLAQSPQPPPSDILTRETKRRADQLVERIKSATSLASQQESIRADDGSDDDSDGGNDNGEVVTQTPEKKATADVSPSEKEVIMSKIFNMLDGKQNEKNSPRQPQVVKLQSPPVIPNLPTVSSLPGLGDPSKLTDADIIRARLSQLRQMSQADAPPANTPHKTFPNPALPQIEATS